MLWLLQCRRHRIFLKLQVHPLCTALFTLSALSIHFEHFAVRRYLNHIVAPRIVAADPPFLWSRKRVQHEIKVIVLLPIAFRTRLHCVVVRREITLFIPTPIAPHLLPQLRGIDLLDVHHFALYSLILIFLSPFLFRCNLSFTQFVPLKTYREHHVQCKLTWFNLAKCTVFSQTLASK